MGKIAIRNDIVENEFDDCVILYLTYMDKFLALDEVSHFIWTSLKNGLNQEQIVIKIEETFEASKAQIEKDIRTVMQAFQDYNIISLEDLK